MRRQLGLYLLGVSIVFLALVALVRNSRAQGSIGNVVGAWHVTVNVNVPPGAPPLVLTELATFHLGGTFTDTISIAHYSQNPFVPPPLAVDFSDAYGRWQQVAGSNQFALTFKRLIFAGPNTPTAVYGSFIPGQQVGEATIEAVGNLQNGGAVAAGTFTFQLTDLNGNQVFADGGTFSATRIHLEPLATP